MEHFVALLGNLISILLSAELFFMLARAIMSWLPFEDDNPLWMFMYYATEPLIEPVRRVINKFPRLNMLPIDISFIVTVILLSIIQGLIEAL
ncbi:MAG: YggT family protein [Oscillospiraceae bacterium]|nr:YggT family protein [Oscillospiraceae bacterium]